MKRNENALKRVSLYEEKYGIRYAKTSGKLYKALAVINLIAVTYLFLTNAAFIIGEVLMRINKFNDYNVNNETLIILSLLTAIEIAAAIFQFIKFKLAASIVSVLPIPYFLILFYKLSEGYESGAFGINSVFYIRHLPELVIIFTASVFMLFIALRQEIRVRKTYNSIIKNMYDKFNKDTDSFTDEDWENYIDNYGKN